MSGRDIADGGKDEEGEVVGCGGMMPGEVAKAGDGGRGFLLELREHGCAGVDGGDLIPKMGEWNS